MKRAFCLAALGTVCWAAPAIYAQADELAAVGIEWILEDASKGVDASVLADDPSTLELAQAPGRRGEGPGERRGPPEGADRRPGPGGPGGPGGPRGIDPARAKALRERLEKMAPEDREKAARQIRLRLQVEREIDIDKPEAKQPKARKPEAKRDGDKKPDAKKKDSNKKVSDKKDGHKKSDAKKKDGDKKPKAKKSDRKKSDAPKHAARGSRRAHGPSAHRGHHAGKHRGSKRSHGHVAHHAPRGHHGAMAHHAPRGGHPVAHHAPRGGHNVHSRFAHHGRPQGHGPRFAHFAHRGGSHGGHGPMAHHGSHGGGHSAHRGGHGPMAHHAPRGPHGGPGKFAHHAGPKGHGPMKGPGAHHNRDGKHDAHHGEHDRHHGKADAPKHGDKEHGPQHAAHDRKPPAGPGQPLRWQLRPGQDGPKGPHGPEGQHHPKGEQAAARDRGHAMAGARLTPAGDQAGNFKFLIAGPDHGPKANDRIAELEKKVDKLFRLISEIREDARK